MEREQRNVGGSSQLYPIQLVTLTDAAERVGGGRAIVRLGNPSRVFVDLEDEASGQSHPIESCSTPYTRLSTRSSYTCSPMGELSRSPSASDKSLCASALGDSQNLGDLLDDGLTCLHNLLIPAPTRLYPESCQVDSGLPLPTESASGGCAKCPPQCLDLGRCMNGVAHKDRCHAPKARDHICDLSENGA